MIAPKRWKQLLKGVYHQGLLGIRRAVAGDADRNICHPLHKSHEQGCLGHVLSDVLGGDNGGAAAAGMPLNTSGAALKPNVHLLSKAAVVSYHQKAFDTRGGGAEYVERVFGARNDTARRRDRSHARRELEAAARQMFSRPSRGPFLFHGASRGIEGKVAGLHLCHWQTLRFLPCAKYVMFPLWY